jgi:hypothetical protein
MLSAVVQQCSQHRQHTNIAQHGRHILMTDTHTHTHQTMLPVDVASTHCAGRRRFQTCNVHSCLGITQNCLSILPAGLFIGSVLSADVHNQCRTSAVRGHHKIAARHTTQGTSRTAVPDAVPVVAYPRHHCNKHRAGQRAGVELEGQGLTSAVEPSRDGCGSLCERQNRSAWLCAHTGHAAAALSCFRRQNTNQLIDRHSTCLTRRCAKQCGSARHVVGKNHGATACLSLGAKHNQSATKAAAADAAAASMPRKCRLTERPQRDSPAVNSTLISS